MLLEVYPDGKAAKDGRLQPGDQILDCNGVKIAREMKHEKALSLIKQTIPKVSPFIIDVFSHSLFSILITTLPFECISDEDDSFEARDSNV